MIAATRWAGKHPLFVRIVLLPILFYLQGRLAFIAGARLFFDGVSLPAYWIWSMLAIIWVATFVYPANARSILYTDYWRIKGLEWIACIAACGLWFYVGNQMAQRFEGIPTKTQSTIAVTMAGIVTSESTASETEPANDNRLKKAYRSYFKNAIKEIKRTHRAQKFPLAVGLILGILGIGVGIAVIVCGIQCGSAGGATALTVISGLALVGLGIWALVAGLSRKSATTLKE